jgi:hypothetical protein
MLYSCCFQALSHEHHLQRASLRSILSMAQPVGPLTQISTHRSFQLCSQPLDRALGVIESWMCVVVCRLARLARGDLLAPSDRQICYLSTHLDLSVFF